MTPLTRCAITSALLAAFPAYGAEGAFVHRIGTPAPVPRFVEAAGDPRLDKLLSPAPADLWERIRKGYAIPDLSGRLVAANEAWYAARPELVASIVSRARRYLHFIVEALERRGMPTELALLPLVESGFNPMAVSSARAAGLWQFIPATATRYGLPQEPHYDARHDIVASTGAALDYLQFLYGLFGDWPLALASYNWGEHAVMRARDLSRARGGDGAYPSLTLPEETRQYVPRLQAVKNLIADPQRFGLALPELANEPYFTVVQIDPALPVALAAKLAELSAEELAALNPARHASKLVIPIDKAAAFEAGYARWLASRRK